MAFILDYAKQKAATYLTAGVQAGGTLAGNAVGGVGSLIESSGKNFAEGIQSGISGVGNRINGYGEGIKGSMAADGPVNTGAKKTAVKKTTPTRASARPTVGGVRGTGSPVVAKGPVGSRSTPVKSGVSAVKKGPVPAAKSRGGQARSPVESSGGGVAAAKQGPSQTKPTQQAANKSTTGKVRISPESKPRPAVKAA